MSESDAAYALASASLLKYDFSNLRCIIRSGAGIEQVSRDSGHLTSNSQGDAVPIFAGVAENAVIIDKIRHLHCVQPDLCQTGTTVKGMVANALQASR